jgi:hypothetical protein
MKEETHDICALLQKLGSSAPALECRLGSQITHVCLNPACSAPALICSNADCGCCDGRRHVACSFTTPANVFALLSKKSQNYKNFINDIFGKEDQLISQLSESRNAVTAKHLASGFAP